METLGQDIRYALRNLGKTPGFAAIAIFTLALGIGASTAIFSVIDNILMEPFPYPAAQRYYSVFIHDSERSEPGGRPVFIGPEFLDYVEQNHAFDRAIGNDRTDMLYRSGEGTEHFDGNFVTPGTFEFLGMPAKLGRVMQPADYEPGAPPVFVLRYKTWVKSFGADPGIVNKTFVLNGESRTLIGIMPPRFGWGGADMWIPGKPSRAAGGRTVAGAFQQRWWMLGHLRPGMTVKEAEADFTVVAKRLATVYPTEYPKRFTVQIESLTNSVVGRFKTTLYIVLAAVALLLLIGCGNVANLLLARATTREKEFAIRSALGASRWRLIRQLLVESLLLAVGGAAVGTLLAWGGLKSLVALMPQNIIPAEAVIRLNMPVLAFTLVTAVLTALVFGLVPALKAARKDLNEPLRDSGKGISGGFRHGRLRDAVVVLEVGLSLTLLVAAGLLMRSFVALRDVKLGLRPDHVLVARLPLPVDRYKTADQVAGFYRPLLQRLKALPGVVEATETSTLPPYGGIPSDIEIRGKTHAEKWNALFQLCSEGYFGVVKIQFLDGRTFTEAEVNGARKLAVVNQTFAKKFLGNENPIGRQVRITRSTDAGDMDTVHGDGIKLSWDFSANRGRADGDDERSAARNLGDGCQCGADVYGDAGKFHQPVFVCGATVWIFSDDDIWSGGAGAGDDRSVQRAGVHDGAADARDWDSHGAGGEELGRAGDGDSNGIAAGGDWRGAWVDCEPCDWAGDCDAAMGSVGVRSVDAGECAGGAVDYRDGGVLAAG